jgi:hypothetical protein
LWAHFPEYSGSGDKRSRRGFAGRIIAAIAHLLHHSEKRSIRIISLGIFTSPEWDTWDIAHVFRTGTGNWKVGQQTSTLQKTHHILRYSGNWPDLINPQIPGSSWSLKFFQVVA